MSDLLIMKPFILAHRGASGYAPENTMKAFALAETLGADGVELDVFLTTDGHVIITHDEELFRLTGQKLITQKQNLKTLKTLDFGEGEKIPTLAYFFDAFGKKFSVINVEIKSTGLRTNGIEQAVLKLIKDFKMIEQVYISSFNPLHLIRFKKMAPEIKRGYLIWPKNRTTQQNFWIARANPQTMNLPLFWLKQSHLEQFGKLERRTWLWDVDNKDSIKPELTPWLSKSLGAIITNYPDRLRALLHSQN
ncbi:MAG: hypothetical protein A2048_06725 [Deltaproteobacteria bacterium GWA2_45_12]|nr:MAG: hypothetical protein A2048_06725 [Deltaproteobacteria bacterium GWA2_45_12]